MVTARAPNGFYFQDPEPDDDPGTSEGLFVFTGGPPEVRIGEAVRVDGRVVEHRASAESLSVTQLVGAEVRPWVDPVLLEIPPTVLGRGGRAIPREVMHDPLRGALSPAPPPSPSSSPPPSPLDAEVDALDFYESLEGMWVRIADAQVVGATNRLGQVWVVADEGEDATGMNATGGITVGLSGPRVDWNPERIQLDDTHFAGPMPRFEVAARLGGIEGVVSSSFGSFELLPTERPAGVAMRRRLPFSRLRGSGDAFTIATYNVDNLDPVVERRTHVRSTADIDDDVGDRRFARLASHVVHHLGSPDLLGLQEVQDSDGAEQTGITDAERTYEALLTAIEAQGGPRYAFCDIPPLDGQDGGQPGGNIRVGFLYRPERLHLWPSEGGPGGSVEAAELRQGARGIELSVNPGRISPGDPAFAGSRKSLVAHFDAGGRSLFVVNNHFTSRRGSSPLQGATQPPIFAHEERRLGQARAVARFVRALRARDPEANVVVLGDMNELRTFPALVELEAGTGLVLADGAISQEERYSYLFEGNAQGLDHILVARHLAAAARFEASRLNTPYLDAASDHDPLMVRIELPAR